MLPCACARLGLTAIQTKDAVRIAGSSLSEIRKKDDATVDLATGKTVDVTTAQHMQTPLSDGEFEAAKTLAREKSDEIRALFDRFGKRLDVYAQFRGYPGWNYCLITGYVAFAIADLIESPCFSRAP